MKLRNIKKAIETLILLKAVAEPELLSDKFEEILVQLLAAYNEPSYKEPVIREARLYKRHVPRTIASFTEAECWIKFRFTKQDLPRLSNY